MNIIMKNAVFSANQMNGGNNGPLPATEEQRNHQCRNGDDTDVFAHEEQTEFHTGIFNVVTIGQFLLRFRLVERVTVTHRHARDGERSRSRRTAG